MAADWFKSVKKNDRNKFKKKNKIKKQSETFGTYLSQTHLLAAAKHTANYPG